MTTRAVHTLLEKFEEVRKLTGAICEPLKLEDYVPQPVEFISPPKWHLAHTTWFFEEFLLKPHRSGYKVFHADFSYFFNSYYNTVGERVIRAERGNMTRPALDMVWDYRLYVDKHMRLWLEEGLPEELHGVMQVGLNHEQQHQELLITDLKYILGHNPLFPVYREQGSLMSDTNTAQGWVPLEAGVYEIGHTGEGFCYDNERARHRTYIQDCKLQKALVTNAEYLEFMSDGGYERHDLWLDEGWAWVNAQHVRSPLYWHHLDGGWRYYTLAGLRKIEPEAILAHVSYYEAAAFAEWKGMRLPTEAEWEVASNQLSWGQRWEWTNSAYLAYPGFRKPEGAVGEYNGKFMINQMVLRGASTATSPGHSRNTYRNFFHPHMQWQYSGIRLATDG